MIKKIIRIIDLVMESAVILLFILMVLVGGLQVFNRFLLNDSLSWSEEFQKFTHIWIIFFTIPVVYNRGGHIGMELLFNKFSKNVKKFLTGLFDLLWLCLAFSIIYYTIRLMQIAKYQTSAGLGVRMDFVYFGMVIGGFYLFFIALRKLKSSLGFIKSPGVN